MKKILKQTRLFFLLVFIAGLSTYPSFAQDKDVELADEYFQQQEYDKAVVLYEKASRNSRNIPFIYKNYFQTLLYLKDYKEAEKLVNRQIKQEVENPTYRIDLAYLQEIQGRIEKADKLYEEIIEEFKKNERAPILAAEHFIRLDKADLAKNMLLSARKAGREKSAFAIELADVYEMLGEQNAMIDEYISYALVERSNIEFVKSALQDRISKPEDFEALEKVLIDRVQKDDNEITYNELLLWLYLQQKRFYRAFIQAKALDKRYRLEGTELLEIGNISMKNKDYKSAQTIFEYIIETYPKSANYPIARNNYIKAKEEVIKNTFPLVNDDINSLIQDYQSLIAEVGKNIKTFDALRSIALLYAFYLNQKDTAIVILNEAVEISKGRTDNIAQCKMDLGDIYLLKSEPWESTLLYSQVEKLKKDHPLGYEAKLKNAKLSFYKGEFSLAQEHLDILKEATTREIANDAMDLSLLIQDHLVFDTTGVALKEFAKIDLMIFQHQDQEALQALQKMTRDYPNDELIDEVLWTKANLLLKVGKTEEALKDLEKIVAEFSDGILGDDAYFLTGKIYEEILQDKEKAMNIYKDHLVKYPGSIYTAEARKRFRILRGDFIN
ncbi:MAG: tetratricopeptide repeat protein [Microscillaceae bacterium]|nr:tetratricopeptide repeat protein [Microscillaceae bacterium]